MRQARSPGQAPSPLRSAAGILYAGVRQPSPSPQGWGVQEITCRTSRGAPGDLEGGKEARLRQDPDLPSCRLSWGDSHGGSFPGKATRLSRCRCCYAVHTDCWRLDSSRRASRKAPQLPSAFPPPSGRLGVSHRPVSCGGSQSGEGSREGLKSTLPAAPTTEGQTEPRRGALSSSVTRAFADCVALDKHTSLTFPFLTASFDSVQ